MSDVLCGFLSLSDAQLSAKVLISLQSLQDTQGLWAADPTAVAPWALGLEADTGMWIPGFEIH